MNKDIIHPKRFQDKNLVLSSFAKRIAVCCPNCHEKAEVEKQSCCYRGQLRCPNCHYQAVQGPELFDLSLQVYCNECAHRITVEIPGVKAKKLAIKVTCPTCGNVESYKPTYSLSSLYTKRDDFTDPFFGLPLWYQESYKSNVLWAYNAEHLLYLEEYVGAKLRERNGRISMTMVERLPSFIKSAKNREEILKLIERMRQKGVK